MNGDLLVLHPESHRGFLFQMKNLTNCFHLFTLLQNELIQPEAGRLSGPARSSALLKLSNANSTTTTPLTADVTAELSANPATIDESSSELFNQPDANSGDNNGELIDTANWHYAQWPALRIDRTISIDPRYLIAGEISPIEIAAFEGQHVVLLGPLTTPRQWPCQNFADNSSSLPAQLEYLKELPPGEVDHMLAKIASTVALEPRWNYGKLDAQIIDGSALARRETKKVLEKRPEQSLSDKFLGHLQPLPRCLVTMTFLASSLGIAGSLLGVLSIFFAETAADAIVAILQGGALGAGLGIIIGFFSWLNWFNHKYQIEPTDQKLNHEGHEEHEV